MYQIANWERTKKIDREFFRKMILKLANFKYIKNAQKHIKIYHSKYHHGIEKVTKSVQG